ncbi:helix-turn-helix domain-containing protein [Streptomyces sp. NPDC057307]|uniref:AraC-like ligand-binding domain-containing protein n=1 Tax=Streptomyces sp. NPDC057307 TaxID=3346096 RepID=UPI00363834ED
MAFTEFDTGLLPREQRFDWWREVVGQGVAPTRITSDFASDFVGSVSALDLGRLQLTRISFPALRSERTADLIRRADPETYELTLILGGLMGISQGRQTSRLAAGDIAMWSSSRPYSGQAMSGPVTSGPVMGGRVTGERTAGGRTAGGRVTGGRTAGGPVIGASEALILHLPRALVPLPEARIDRLLAHGLSARAGIGRVLAGFLGSLMGEAAVLDERSRARLGETGLDLAAGFLAHRLDAQEHLAPEARHESLLRRIDVFIRDNLADPALTPGAIAARHHISVRLLHQLFRQREETVAASIRRRRLEGCYADLAEPRLRGLSVQDIGARWGLGNGAAFGRMFRGVYGITPGERRHCPLPSDLARLPSKRDDYRFRDIEP